MHLYQLELGPKVGISWSRQEPLVQKWGNSLPSLCSPAWGGHNLQRTKAPLSSMSGHVELQAVLLNMESWEERKKKKRTGQEQSLFRILRIAKLLGNSPGGSVLISEA